MEELVFKYMNLRRECRRFSLFRVIYMVFKMIVLFFRKRFVVFFRSRIFSWGSEVFILFIVFSIIFLIK